LKSTALESYAQVVRAAIDLLLEAKQERWDERHPAAKRMGLKEPKKD
jgi:Arc/MetJ-type ribon-helix-helix transcriptional regulator